MGGLPIIAPALTLGPSPMVPLPRERDALDEIEGWVRARSGFDDVDIWC